MSDDPYQLHRFVEAQDRAGAYESALNELRAGRKTSHWIWFIFPQIAGLGRSQMARTYAIGSIGEAQAYLSHAILGPRLLKCTRTLLELTGRTAVEVLGDVDAIKLRSSMTLFVRAAPDETAFQAVLDRYYNGSADEMTEQRL